MVPDFVTRLTCRSRGTALRGIEPVRDELEFRDHLLTEGGLAAAAHGVLKLLAVDVGLKLANTVGIPRVVPIGLVARRPAARRQQQQRAPVALLLLAPGGRMSSRRSQSDQTRGMPTGFASFEPTSTASSFRTPWAGGGRPIFSQEMIAEFQFISNRLISNFNHFLGLSGQPGDEVRDQSLHRLLPQQLPRSSPSIGCFAFSFSARSDHRYTASCQTRTRCRPHTGTSSADVESLSWIFTRPPASALHFRWLPDLGPGEREVLALALETPNSICILDDALARRIANGLHLQVTGILGILIDAKRAGLIAAVRPLIDQLQMTGFRLAPQTRTAVLAIAEE